MRFNLCEVIGLQCYKCHTHPQFFWIIVAVLQIVLVVVVPLFLPLRFSTFSRGHENIIYNSTSDENNSRNTSTICAMCPSRTSPLNVYGRYILPFDHLFFCRVLIHVGVTCSMVSSFGQLIFHKYNHLLRNLNEVTNIQVGISLSKKYDEIALIIRRRESWMINTFKAETLLHGGFFATLALLASVTSNTNLTQSNYCYERELWMMICCASCAAVMSSLSASFATSSTALKDTLQSVLSSTSAGKTFLVLQILKFVILHTLGCVIVNCTDKCIIRAQVIDLYLLALCWLEGLRFLFCWIKVEFNTLEYSEDGRSVKKVKKISYVKALNFGKISVDITKDARQGGDERISVIQYFDWDK